MRCDREARGGAPGVEASALVHAAGVLRVGRLGQLNAEAGALMWHLHVEAVTRIADVLLPAMAAARHGRVVLVGSRVAQGKAGRSQYAATETAMTNDPARRSEAPVLPRSADPARRSRIARRLPAVARGGRDHRPGHRTVWRRLAAALNTFRKTRP